jgi:hypothetical protein
MSKENKFLYIVKHRNTLAQNSIKYGHSEIHSYLIKTKRRKIINECTRIEY